MHQIDTSSLVHDGPIQSLLFPNTSYLGRACVWITDNLIQPLESLVNFIYNYFNNFNPSTFNLHSIRAKLLNDDHLVSAKEFLIHRPLTNLGSTCYINSCLNVLASCNAFDTLLTKKIDDVNSESLQKKQALQSHLGALINKLRSGNPSETISYENLKTLFLLCQSLGWHTRAKNASIQADAEEFLSFLKDILDFDESDMLILRFSLQEGKTETLSDQISAYVNQNKGLIFQKELPSFLIINESRSIYEDGQFVKIHSPVSVPIDLSFPLATSIEHKQNKPIVYQLEAAICHHSKYCSSGHYTAVGRYSNQYYIKYNDKKLPKVLDSLDEIKETCTQLFYRLKQS